MTLTGEHLDAVIATSECQHCGRPCELLTVPAIAGFSPIWQHHDESGRDALCDPELWVPNGRSDEGYRAAGGRFVEPTSKIVVNREPDSFAVCLSAASDSLDRLMSWNYHHDEWLALQEARNVIHRMRKTVSDALTP